MDQKQLAKQLKSNRLLGEILAELDTDIIQSWRSANTVDAREQCATDLRAIEALRETIGARLNDILSGDREGRNDDNGG